MTVVLRYEPPDSCRLLKKEERVPKLEVEGVGEFDVEEGKRLVLAIEEVAGVDILNGVGSQVHNQ